MLSLVGGPTKQSKEIRLLRYARNHATKTEHQGIKSNEIKTEYCP